MDTKDWIAIGIAMITLINGWCQFWVKERLFNDGAPVVDGVLSMFKSKSGISLIAFSGVASIASIWLLIGEATSNEPITRLSSFAISGLTVLSILNIILVQTLFTLRRLAVLKEQIERSKAEMAARVMGGI